MRGEDDRRGSEGVILRDHRPLWPVEGEDGGERRVDEVEGDGDLLAAGGEGGRRRGAVAVEAVPPRAAAAQEHPGWVGSCWGIRGRIAWISDAGVACLSPCSMPLAWPYDGGTIA